MPRIGSTVRFVVTVYFGAGRALSQFTFGRIVGSVRDSSGARMRGLVRFGLASERKGAS